MFLNNNFNNNSSGNYIFKILSSIFLIITMLVILIQSSNSNSNKINEFNNEKNEVRENINNSNLENIISNLPLEKYIKITSRFGPRINPVTKKASNHSGVDFANSEGTKLISIRDSKVIYTGFKGAFGYTIMLKDLYTNYIYLYAHVDPKFKVKVNQYVKKGDVIGNIGPKYVENSPIKDYTNRGINGYTTGAHLHFSLIENGKFINPAIVLGEYVN